MSEQFKEKVIYSGLNERYPEKLTKSKAENMNGIVITTEANVLYNLQNEADQL